MFEELLNPPKYRWPEVHDQLLVPARSPERAGQIYEDGLTREVLMGDGYMRAGAALVERCLQDNDESHYLIYPILFNYRHGLELAIKWVLDRYGRHAAIEEFKRDHNLKSLWKVCRQVIEEIGGPDSGGSLEVVEGIVNEFHNIDPNSFAFRYAKDTKGRLIKLPLHSIDLENVRDVMEGVANFFQGVDGQLDHNSSAVDCNY
jgi:hypothetical protein